MDSDSDNDILTNNVFTFQNRNMTVCAKGPNMTNRTSLSFHNKVLSSTMHMPRNMEHSRYASSVYDQRSIHSRREVSPMSVQSAYDFQPRNSNMAHYPRAMSSQKFMMNGRSGSPMSMTSTASVSAIDIAMAFKNAQFNKHDLKIITEAYHKYVKRKIRKKFEKRRNIKRFLKGVRGRSGGESGEQGSDSSISDDDCRSNKTSLFKENMSSCRSTRTDLTDIRRKMQESNIHNDCSANLKQKSVKNAFSIDSGTFHSNVCSKPQNGSILQKDRFKSRFLLPSQRFNKSVAVSTITENTDKQQKVFKEPCTNDKQAKNFISTDSEQEEIFANTTVRHKEVNTEAQLKRSLEKDEDTLTPHKKRNKLSPIKKIADKDILDNEKNHVNENREDFNFAKPLFPIRKPCNSRVKEKLISKSPHVNTLIAKNDVFKQNQIPSVPQGNQEKEQNQSREPIETTQHCNTDVSMRPSFIKRKLYTQKLDVAEAKNLSSDNVDNTPNTVYSAIQKEKHKARKLVTNQSCLTRDVLQEDNLLDLIHKIVPAEKINSTSQTNRSDTQRKSKDVEDNWDITSVLSNINNDDLSDTYTDEDIFKDSNKTNNNNIKKSKRTASKNDVNKSMPQCQILMERIRIPAKNMQKETKLKNYPKKIDAANVKNCNQSNIKTCAKSFWDTDLETDFEDQETPKQINTSINIQKNDVNKKAVDQHPKKIEPKKIAADITTTSIQKFNKTSLGIRSHRVPKKKICCPELDPPNTSFKAQSKKPQVKEVSCSPYPSPAKNIKPNNKTSAVPENKIKNGRPIRACRTPKQTPKENTNQSKKTNIKSEVNRTLRSRNSDLSNSTLNDSVITRNRAKLNKKLGI